MKTVLMEKSNIDEIVTCLQFQQVIAFPTETVFGLGTIVHSLVGLEKIYELKQRKEDKAITLMVATKEEISTYAKVGVNAQKIIDNFMPGKLTIVFRKKNGIDDVFTANLATIGIRIPDDPFVLELLKRVGPMWVTSANLSGTSNMTTDREVYQQFNQRIPLIIKGQTDSTVASTVIDMQEDRIDILRDGNITKEMLEGVLEDENCNSM